MITIDFETRSEADLTKVGAHAYAEHPSTDVMCMAYGSEHLPIRLWVPGMRFPFARNATFLIEAHNVEFERCIWTEVMVKKYGWPEIAVDRWRCSAAKSRYNSIPGKLENGALALGLINQKDSTGHRVMLRMTKPRKPTEKDPDSKWNEEPKNKVKLYAYCCQDVRTEMELSGRLRGMTRHEHAIWQLDQRMNERGLYIDVEAAQAAVTLIEGYQGAVGPEISRLTDGRVTSAGQIAVIVEWCEEQGTLIPNLQKATIEKYLNDFTLPDNVREVLLLRQGASKSSVKKLHAMVNRLSRGGRVRGSTKYCGAERTGRWAGTGIQPQNLPRPILSQNEIETCIEFIRRGDKKAVECFGSPLEVISSCIRGMIMAEKGNILRCADFSAIEARVLVWLAGDKEAVQRYLDNIDPYKDMAARLFKIEYEDVNADQRQFGKKVILGLGYGMGEWKFYSECLAEGIGVDRGFCEKAVNLFRNEAYPRIYNYWGLHEDAAMSVVRSGIAESVGLVKWAMDKDFLRAILPSGRTLSYYQPELQMRNTPWGQDKLALTYMGINSKTKQWTRDHTYGGKLVENIVQATSRDFMADAMLRVEEAGYSPVLTVHDEILCEDDKNFGSLDEYVALMEEVPQWGEGCPIAAEGWEGERYRK